MSKDSSAGSFTRIRQAVMVILLLVFVGAFLYEFTNVRPSHQQASDDISAMMDMSNALPGRSPFTPVEVRKLVGFEPSESTHSPEDSKQYLIEEYHWKRAIPTKTFFETVIYKRRNSAPEGDYSKEHYAFFKALSSNQKWQPLDIPRNSFEKPERATPESALKEMPRGAGAFGGGGGQGRGKGKGGKKKRPDADDDSDDEKKKASDEKKDESKD